MEEQLDWIQQPKEKIKIKGQVDLEEEDLEEDSKEITIGKEAQSYP